MLCKQVARLLYFRIFFLSKNIVTTNVISMYYYADIIHTYIESSINLTSYPIRYKQFSFSKHRILPKKLLTLSMLSPRFNVIDRVENERGEFPRIPRLEKLKNIGLEKINFSHWRGELRDRQRPLEPDGRLSSLEGGAHARTYTRSTVCQPLFYDSAARLTAD